MLIKNTNASKMMYYLIEKFEGYMIKQGQIVVKNKLVDKEFWFENEEDAYRFKSHIDSKMEATIIYAPELEDYDLEFEDE